MALVCWSRYAGFPCPGVWTSTHTVQCRNYNHTSTHTLLYQQLMLMSLLICCSDAVNKQGHRIAAQKPPHRSSPDTAGDRTSEAGGSTRHSPRLKTPTPPIWTSITDTAQLPSSSTRFTLTYRTRKGFIWLALSVTLVTMGSDYTRDPTSGRSLIKFIHVLDEWRDWTD